jgi:hypothetical protein
MSKGKEFYCPTPAGSEEDQLAIGSLYGRPFGGEATNETVGKGLFADRFVSSLVFEIKP